MIFLDGIIYSLQKAGGITTYFNEILTACIQRPGLDAHLILVKKVRGHRDFSPMELPMSVRPYRRLEQLRRVELAPIPCNSVFLSSYYRLPAGPIPSVVTVHDFIHRRFGGGARNRTFVWQQSRAIRSAHRIICVSENTKRDLFEFFPEVSPNRVSVIHNGVSDAYYPLPEAHRENSVVVVGNRSGYKNFRQAVQAMAYLPNHRLEIVGGGALTVEEQLLLEANCSGRYTTHGYLIESELNLVYNRCRALLYLSDYEGFGIPPLEAMRAGCVPIVKRTSSLPEVVGYAGQFVQSSPEDVASRVLSLSNTEAFEQASADGLNQSKRFSWRQTGEQTLNVLFSAAADTVQSKIL